MHQDLLVYLYTLPADHRNKLVRALLHRSYHAANAQILVPFQQLVRANQHLIELFDRNTVLRRHVDEIGD